MWYIGAPVPVDMVQTRARPASDIAQERKLEGKEPDSDTFESYSALSLGWAWIHDQNAHRFAWPTTRSGVVVAKYVWLACPVVICELPLPLLVTVASKRLALPAFILQPARSGDMWRLHSCLHCVRGRLDSAFGTSTGMRTRSEIRQIC